MIRFSPFRKPFQAPRTRWTGRMGWIAGLLVLALQPVQAQPVRFQANDRVVFIGNTFAERLQYEGYVEAYLTARLADLNLTFRNLGWSGDTVRLRPRPLNFGDLHTHLAEQEADVIFASFGMGESFEGEAGVAAFERDLAAFTDTLLSHRYNGTTPPRVVLVSPIAQEPHGPAYLDVEGRNRDLERYTGAVRRAAEAEGVGFIDLFAPTHALMTAPDARPLTGNGIHLTPYGDWVVAQVLAEALGLATPWRVTLDAAAGTAAETAADAENGITVTDLTTEGTGLSFSWAGPGSALPPPPPEASAPPALADAQPRLVVANLEPGTYALRANGEVIAQGDHTDWAAGLAVYPQDPALRPAIVEKNELFFLRWRAVNGEYIYGRRKEPFGVVNFPGEMERLEEKIAAEEARIHALAAAPLRPTWRLERVEQP